MANRKRRQYQIKNYSMYDFNILNIAERQGTEINIAENQVTELIMSIKNRDYDEGGVNPIPELIFLETGNKVNKIKLENLLKEGLHIEDRHYVRFIRSSSMARNGTIAFIQDNLYEQMMKLISLGKIDSFGETVISKTESYLGLAFSTTMFINAVPQNICIVDSDKFKVIINDYVKTVKDNQVIQGKYDVEVELFDGQGLHSPSWGKKVAKALGLSDRPAGLQIRLLPSVKGMSYEIDFKKFYQEHGIEYIEDYTGKMWKVSDLDCIWTTSMFKFSKYFNGWQELKELREKYYTPINQNLIGISAWSCSKDNNKYAKMTYQYLQSLSLNSDNLIELSQYTKDLVSRVYGGDLGATMIFLGLLADTNEDDEESIDEETFMATKIHYVLGKNPEMLHDPYVQSFLQRQLKKTITNLKLGKFYIQGQYSFLCQDPVMMMEMIADLKPIGSLEKGEFYSTGAEGEYASFRSPLIHSSEVQRMNFINNEITDKWLLRYKNIIVMNGFDITVQSMGNGDFDGDTALWTNNPAITNAVIDKFADGTSNYPVSDIYESANRAEATEEKYNIDNIINYDMRTLDNKIGEITNIATYFSNAGYKDLKKYDKEIVIARLMQGEEIDYCKHNIRTITPPDDFKEASRYKPYFLQRHKYNRNKNIQQDVVNAPLNVLCYDIEQFEEELFKIDKVKINDTLKYIRDTELINENLEETNRLYIELQQIHEQFKKESSSIYLKCRNKSDKYRQKVYDSFYNKYHVLVNQLSNDKELLSSIAVQINYVDDKIEKSDRRSYLFPWVTTWEGLTYTINKTAPATVKIPRKLTNEDMIDKDNLIEFLGNLYEVKEVTNKLDAEAFVNKEYERKINKELMDQMKDFEIETVLYGYKPKTTEQVVDIIKNNKLRLGTKEYNNKHFAGIFADDEYIASIKDKTEEFLDDEAGLIDLKQMNNKVNVNIIETSKSSIKVRLQIAG